MSHVGSIIYGADLQVWEDIAAVLGVNSGDVEYLFTQGGAKPFAKYKPVRSPIEPELTEADFKAVNYGLRISKFTSMSALITGITGGNEWAYIIPNQIGDALRVADFANPAGDDQPGYNHDARSFIESVEVPATYRQGSGGGTFLRVRMTPANQLPAGNLHWSDLTDINGDSISYGDLYFGALFVKGSSYMYITASSKISADSYTAELFISSAVLDALATGSWTVYLCAAYTSVPSAVTVQGTINTDMSTGVFAIPGATAKTIEIQAAATGGSASIQNLSAAIGAGRFTVDFDIQYKATSQPVTIHADYKIYGGSNYGDKTIQYESGSVDLSATSTTQTYGISKTIRQGIPNYVTVELSYRVGSSQTVYTAPDESVPVV